MKNFNSDDFLSRNMGLISKKTQRKILDTVLLIVGTGLGSQIALLAARTGFKKFILYDGDKVELNNLNRQAFEIADIGKNKAEVTKEKILAINPNCEVEAFPKYIQKVEDLTDSLAKSDIIINMADPGDIIYEINNKSQKMGKPVFLPLNFVFGAYLLIFSPESDSLEKIIGSREIEDFFSKLIINTLKHKPGIIKSKDFLSFQKIYMDAIEAKKPIPQCGISTNITSALVLKEIIKWIEGLPQEFAPKPIIFYPWK